MQVEKAKHLCCDPLPFSPPPSWPLSPPSLRTEDQALPLSPELWKYITTLPTLLHPLSYPSRPKVAQSL